MKRRVRMLMRRHWLSPMCALLLAVVPILLISLLNGWFFAPKETEPSVLSGFSWSFSDPMSIIAQLLMLFSDPMLLLQPVLGWLPMVGLQVGLSILIILPILVGISAYFLAFLRGKQPAPTMVFSSFSARYPRALGGMAYMMLWLLIWFVVCFAVPSVLLFGSVPFVSNLGIELNTQIYIFLGVVIVCAIWYVAFFFVFLNRLLAYALVPTCLAAQPRLPAHRAVRLSRKLMQGFKWRLIGLFFSFIVYFIPSILCGLGLWFLSAYGLSFGISETLLPTIRTVLWVIILANQLLWLYVGPYMAASFNAFYIERKREALMDDEVTPDDFGGNPTKQEPTGHRDSLPNPYSR